MLEREAPQAAAPRRCSGTSETERKMKICGKCWAKAGKKRAEAAAATPTTPTAVPEVFFFSRRAEAASSLSLDNGTRRHRRRHRRRREFDRSAVSLRRNRSNGYPKLFQSLSNARPFFPDVTLYDGSLGLMASTGGPGEQLAKHGGS